MTDTKALAQPRNTIMPTREEITHKGPTGIIMRRYIPCGYGIEVTRWLPLNDEAAIEKFRVEADALIAIKVDKLNAYWDRQRGKTA